MVYFALFVVALLAVWRENVNLKANRDLRDKFNALADQMHTVDYFLNRWGGGDRKLQERFRIARLYTKASLKWIAAATGSKEESKKNA